MPNCDLTTDEGPKGACEEVPSAHDSPDYTSWIEGLASDFGWVAEADEAERATVEFQTRLWEDNRVSSVGQGNVSVVGAPADEDFRGWLAQCSLAPLSEGAVYRSTLLKAGSAHCRRTCPTA